MKKNSRQQFTPKHTKRLRAELVALLDRSNVYLLPERRIALATAITVANRDLRKTRNSEPDARVFSALRAVSGYVSLAAHNKITTASLQNADLLPVGHPMSTREHAMTASALRHAQAQWIAADPLIDDSVRALVASAHSAEPGSIERRHAFLRISALGAGLVPLTASIDMNTQVLPASEFIFGFGLGGDSKAARSARAQMQRRDRYGKFAFMGGGFSFSLRGLEGLFTKISGGVVGQSGSGDDIQVEVRGHDVLPDGIYTMPASKGSSVKAILSKEAVKGLPGEGVGLGKDDVFVDINDVLPTRMDAPNGWTKIDTSPNAPDAWRSGDGYFVQKDGDVFTLHRANLEDNSIGDEVARGNSWSDMQKAALQDQDAYEKVLEAADVAKPEGRPLPENVKALDPNSDVPLQRQIEDAIKSGDQISFKYSGKDRLVTPQNIYTNPKNGNVNVRAIDDTGTAKTFTLDKIDAPEAAGAGVGEPPKPPTTPVGELGPGEAPDGWETSVASLRDDEATMWKHKLSGTSYSITEDRSGGLFGEKKPASETQPKFSAWDGNNNIGYFDSWDESIQAIEKHQSESPKRAEEARLAEEAKTKSAAEAKAKADAERAKKFEKPARILSHDDGISAKNVLDKAVGEDGPVQFEYDGETIVGLVNKPWVDEESFVYPVQLEDGTFVQVYPDKARMTPATPPTPLTPEQKRENDIKRLAYDLYHSYVPPSEKSDGKIITFYGQRPRDAVRNDLINENFTPEERQLFIDSYATMRGKFDEQSAENVRNELARADEERAKRGIAEAPAEGAPSAPGAPRDGWSVSAPSAFAGETEWFHRPKDSGVYPAHTITERLTKDGKSEFDVWQMGWAINKHGDNKRVAAQLGSWDDAIAAIEADMPNVDAINAKREADAAADAAKKAEAIAARAELEAKYPDLKELEAIESRAFYGEVRDKEDRGNFTGAEGPLSENLDKYPYYRVEELINDLEKINNKTEKTNDRLAALKAEKQRRDDLSAAERAKIDARNAEILRKEKEAQAAEDAKFLDRDWVTSEVANRFGYVDWYAEYADDYDAYSRGLASQSRFENFVKKANLTEEEKRRAIDLAPENQRERLARYLKVTSETEEPALLENVPGEPPRRDQGGPEAGVPAEPKTPPSAPSTAEALVDEEFDSMFEAPDGAYKLDMYSVYAPKGRTNEDSTDFTDDPQVLSQKFTKEQLTLALADALVAPGGGDATGYGNLPFNEGDEAVKAEALYEALALRGEIDPERVVAGIYDSAMDPDRAGVNMDMYEQRVADAALLGEDRIGLTPTPVLESTFMDSVARNGVLGTPSRTQLTTELLRDHVETNPKIIALADDLKNLQDTDVFGDGENFMPMLEKYLPLAYSNDPEEKAAFRAFWGLLMSLDGGSSEENETNRSGFRANLFGALERYHDVAGTEEAQAVYDEFVKEFGNFDDFVDEKTDIANGIAGLDEGTIAGDFFRLIKASARPNEKPLFRVVPVSPKNQDLLDQYTTEGNILGFDPRPFSTIDSTGGEFTDSLTWSSSDKNAHRIVFVAAPGEIDSIDVTSVSWFPGEQEHIAHGQLEIVSVRRQPSGLPGRADEFIVEVRRTDRTPADLTGEQSFAAGEPSGLNLQTYDVAGWKQTGGQAGSNEGGFYEDANGVGYYVKIPKSASHAENEVLASVFYQELGVPAAEVRLGDDNGDQRIVSKLILGVVRPEDYAMNDLEKEIRANNQDYLEKLRADFAIDAWLSNYDVTGTGWDNVVTDGNGNPVRVDPGGALMWRARGSSKEGMFGDTVAEIDGLRDPQLNMYSAAVFGDMTDEDVKNSARKLLDISPSRIDEIVDTVVSSPDDRALLKERLKNRRQYILDRFGLSEKDDDVLGTPVPLTNSIGFAAQDLAPGDVTADDSFVIERVFRDENTPKGKVSVQGYYPGHESQRKEWNESTVINAARGSTAPPKGDAPALHRPAKPYEPTPPAFVGDIADEIAAAESWDDVRRILNGRDLVFFDYETTGFDPGSNNMPVQLGAVKVRDGQVVDRFNVFMDPREDLSQWSLDNLKDGDGNPLTDEFLAQQVGMGEAHSLFAEWAGDGSVLVAHNTPFDREILERINKQENVDFTPGGYVDTLALSRALVKKKSNDNPDGPTSHRLPSLLEHYGQDFEGWHTADADAEAVSGLLGSLLDDASGKPDAPELLAAVKDQPEVYKEAMDQHSIALERYKDELAKYNMDKAIASAWNCGGAGLTASVGEGNGPCSVPSVDELVETSSVKPGSLLDPEAVTSGDPSVEGDMSSDPVEIPADDGKDNAIEMPVGVDALPTEEERQKNIDESFDSVDDQINLILDPETFKLKNVMKKNIETARADIADVRDKLKNGEITEKQAIAMLNEIIDSLPTSKNEDDLDIEIGVLRDTVIDLRSSIDNTIYQRPQGPGLPPLATHASRGYSKDGVFLLPGAKVRDKWGYSGTVLRYNEAGWINVYFVRDIDGKPFSRNTQTLTTIADGEDNGWSYVPGMNVGKLPDDWESRVTPDEKATIQAELDKIAKKAAKKSGAVEETKLPKAEAPKGASETPEIVEAPGVNETPETPKSLGVNDPELFGPIVMPSSAYHDMYPAPPFMYLDESQIGTFAERVKNREPILVSIDGEPRILNVSKIVYDEDTKRYRLSTYDKSGLYLDGPVFMLDEISPVSPDDVRLDDKYSWEGADNMSANEYRDEVADKINQLLAVGKFEEAGELTGRYIRALDRAVADLNLSLEVENFPEARYDTDKLIEKTLRSKSVISKLFGTQDLPQYDHNINSVRKAIDRITDPDKRNVARSSFITGWNKSDPLGDISLSGRPQPKIDDPKPISASSFDGVDSLMGAIDKVVNKDGSNEVYHSAAVDGSDVEDFEIRTSVIVDKNTGERKLRLKFKLTAWSGQNKTREIIDLIDSSANEPDKWEVTRNPFFPRTRTLPNGDIEVDKEKSMFAVTDGVKYTKKIETSSGEAEISIFRSTDDASLRPSNVRSAHNVVNIELPIDATEDDVKRALETSGIADVRATDPVDLRILAENRLLSVFGRDTDASTNERDQDIRREKLDEIKDRWGVTADDLKMSTDPAGFLSFDLPTDVAKKIADVTAAEALEHQISVSGIENYLIDTVPQWLSRSTEQRRADIASVLVDVVTKGLKSTLHRYTEGASVSGQSSEDDLRTGGADYVFVTPRGRSGVRSRVYDDLSAFFMFDPTETYRRSDIYANQHDEFGRRAEGRDVISAARAGGYEVMFKRGLSTDSAYGMLVTPQMREAILDELRNRKIEKIAGVPIEEFVVDVFDIDEARTRKENIGVPDSGANAKKLKSWMNSQYEYGQVTGVDIRNNLSDLAMMARETVTDPKIADEASYFEFDTQYFTENDMVVGYDVKGRVLVYDKSTDKFYLIDMTPGESSRKSLSDENAKKALEQLKHSEDYLYDANAIDKTVFSYPGEKGLTGTGLDDFVPAGKHAQAQVQSTVSIIERLAEYLSDDAVGPVQAASFLFRIMLNSYDYKSNIVMDAVQSLLSANPSVANALVKMRMS